MLTLFRDATAPLDDIFNETLEYCGRMYQKYALANGTYFVPIDEVGLVFALLWVGYMQVTSLCRRAGLTMIANRKKSIVWNLCMQSSAKCSIIV